MLPGNIFRAAFVFEVFLSQALFPAFLFPAYLKAVPGNVVHFLFWEEGGHSSQFLALLAANRQFFRIKLLL